VIEDNRFFQDCEAAPFFDGSWNSSLQGVSLEKTIYLDRSAFAITMPSTATQDSATEVLTDRD